MLWLTWLFNHNKNVIIVVVGNVVVRIIVWWRQIAAPSEKKQKNYWMTRFARICNKHSPQINRVLQLQMFHLFLKAFPHEMVIFYNLSASIIELLKTKIYNSSGNIFFENLLQMKLDFIAVKEFLFENTIVCTYQLFKWIDWTKSNS